MQFESCDSKFEIVTFFSYTHKKSPVKCIKNSFSSQSSHIFIITWHYIYMSDRKISSSFAVKKPFLTSHLPWFLLREKMPILYTNLSKPVQGRDASKYNNSGMLQNISTYQMFHFYIWTSLPDLQQCSKMCSSAESDLLHHVPTFLFTCPFIIFQSPK